MREAGIEAVPYARPDAVGDDVRGLNHSAHRLNNAHDRGRKYHSAQSPLDIVHPTLGYWCHAVGNA